MTTEGLTNGRLLAALHFAATKHREQRRKDQDRTPYINHPIAVANLLTAVGRITDLDTLVAAVLHDTIEDTQTTPDELEDNFGRSVRKLVLEVTDDKTLEKHVRKQLQIEHAPRMSTGAKLIKLADLSSNLADVARNPPATWSLDRCKSYLDWTERVIAGCRGVNRALERHYDVVMHEGRTQLASSDDYSQNRDGA